MDKLKKALISLVFLVFFVVIINDIFNVLVKKTLEIEVVSPGNGTWQVFYNNGNGFRERDSSFPIIKKVGGKTKLFFDLYTLKLFGMRIDPGAHADWINVKTITYHIGLSSQVWKGKDIVRDFKPSAGKNPHFQYAGNLGAIDERLDRPYDIVKAFIYFIGLCLAVILYFKFNETVVILNRAHKFASASYASFLSLLKRSKVLSGAFRILASKNKPFYLYLIPALLFFILGLIYLKHYAVNIIFYDDWSAMKNIIRLQRTGGLKLVDLFAQQNEHRPFIPRTVWVLSYLIKPWSIIKLLYLNQVIILISTCLLLLLVRKEKMLDWFSAILVPAIMFSFVPTESLLWTGYSISFCSMFFLFALYYFVSIKNIYLKIAVSYLFCLFSSYSMGQGALSLVIILLLILFSGPAPKRMSKWVLAAIWGILSAISLLLYFQPGFKLTHDASSSAVLGLKDPLFLLAYFFTFLGNIFYFSFDQGIIVLFGIFIFAAYLFFVYRERQRYPIVLSIASFGVFYAVLVSFARCGFGIEEAFSPRYMSTSMFALLCVFLLLGKTLPKNIRSYSKLAMLILVIYISIQSLPYSEIYRQQMLKCREALTLAVKNGDYSMYNDVYPSKQGLKSIVKKCKESGVDLSPFMDK